MKLVFCGNKLNVDQFGYHFGGSQDKYLFLKYLVGIMKVLRKLEATKASIDLKEVADMRDEDILKFIVDTSVKETLLEQRVQRFKEKLEKEMEIVEGMNLTDLEKNIYINNLKLSADYRLQRAFNKSVYHIGVDEVVANVIRKDVISIKTPFIPQYFHLLGSLKNGILGKKFSSTISMEIVREGENTSLVLNNPLF